MKLVEENDVQKCFPNYKYKQARISKVGKTNANSSQNEAKTSKVEENNTKLSKDTTRIRITSDKTDKTAITSDKTEWIGTFKLKIQSQKDKTNRENMS